MAAAVQTPVQTSLPRAARPLPPDMDVDLDFGDDETEAAIMNLDEKALEISDSTDPSAIRSYTRNLLPFKSLFTWLNRDQPHLPTKNFVNREFAFTLQNDAYLRYNSFNNWEEFKKEVCRVDPLRFEIGPVYSAKPKDKKTVNKTAFKPVARELVFDIDITDYDDIRVCCSDKAICKRCWGLIAVAVKVLDSTLRDDFGFKHLLWVYSGRRGIHLWISDSEAFNLTDECRRSLVGWLEIIKGSGKSLKKVNAGSINPTHGRTLHPSLKRALGDDEKSGPLKDAFVEVILKDQNCFRERKHWETLLDLLPTNQSNGDLEIISRLRTKWEKDPTRRSLEKWGDIMNEMNKIKKERQNVWKPHLEDIILQYTYPRIDSEVSKKMNHLLKSPFVVHPSTGNVCIPLNVEMIQDFDPLKDCPTVGMVLREFNKNSNKGEEIRKGMEWEKTSLKPYVEILDRYCAGIIKETRAAKKALEEKSNEF